MMYKILSVATLTSTLVMVSCQPPNTPEPVEIEAVGELRPVTPQSSTSRLSNQNTCTTYFYNPMNNCQLDYYTYPCTKGGIPPIMHFVTTGKFGFAGSSQGGFTSPDPTGILPDSNGKVTMTGDFYIVVPCEHIPEIPSDNIINGVLSTGIPLFPNRERYNGIEVPPIEMELKIFRNDTPLNLGTEFNVEYNKVKVEYNYPGTTKSFDNSVVVGNEITSSDYSYTCVPNSKEVLEPKCAAILNVVVTYDMPAIALSSTELDKYTMTLEAIDIDASSSAFHSDSNSAFHHEQTISQLKQEISPKCNTMNKNNFSYYNCVNSDTSYHMADHIAIVHLPYHKNQKAKPGSPGKIIVSKENSKTGQNK